MATTVDIIVGYIYLFNLSKFSCHGLFLTFLHKCARDRFQDTRLRGSTNTGKLHNVLCFMYRSLFLLELSSLCNPRACMCVPCIPLCLVDKRIIDKENYNHKKYKSPPEIRGR